MAKLTSLIGIILFSIGSLIGFLLEV